MSQNETVAADAPDARNIPAAPRSSAASRRSAPTKTAEPDAPEATGDAAPATPARTTRPAAKKAAPAAKKAAAAKPSAPAEPAPLTLRDRYAARTVGPLGVLEHEGWRLKATGISAGDGRPRNELLKAARDVVASVLPPVTGRYGIGFLGVHDGPASCSVTVGWWENEDELHVHRFAAPSDSPEALKDVTGSGVLGDAWDVGLIGHERRAWVDTVLAFSEGPDLLSYLDTSLVGKL